MYPFASPMMMARAAVIAPATTTWSQNDKAADWGLSTDLRTATRNDNQVSYSAVRGSSFRASGKVYFELYPAAVGGTLMFALANSSYGLGTGIVAGADATAIRYQQNNGNIVFSGVAQATGKSPIYAGETILGIALDRDAGTIGWYASGVLQFTSTQIPAGPLAPVLSNNSFGSVVKINCGQDPFAYGPPAGFSPWG